VKRSKKERLQIRQQILAYLDDHPDAQDTLEGIVQWWLLEREIQHWMGRVKDALDELVAEGLISEYEGRDGQIHYRLIGKPLLPVSGKTPG